MKNDDETTYHSYSDMFLIYLAGPGLFREDERGKEGEKGKKKKTCQ